MAKQQITVGSSTGTQAEAIIDDNFTELYDNRTSISVMDAPYNAVGDGSADDTTPIQDALDDVASLGVRRIVFPPGRYKITSSLTLLNPFGVELVGLAGAGAQKSRPPVSIETTSAIQMMVIGDAATTNWSGPTIKNIGFYGDASTIGGLKLTRVNHSTLENYYATNMTTGAGLWLDGDGDSTQYTTIINPRITDCFYGITKSGNTADTTIIGGRLWMPITTPVSGSIGIGHQSANTGSGRWNIYGLGINNFETGIDASQLRYSHLQASIENNGAGAPYAGTVGISCQGVNGNDQGNGNTCCSLIVGFDVGVDVGVDAVGTVLSCKFTTTTTRYSDSGTKTIAGVLLEPGNPNHSTGIQYSYQDHNSNPRTMNISQYYESYNQTNPCFIHPTANPFLIKNAQADGGAWLGSDKSGGGSFGAGVAGSAAGPYATNSSGGWLRFDNDTIRICQFAGSTAGTAQTTGANTRVMIKNGTLYLKDTDATGATETGYGGLYIDPADGDLKIKFASGNIVVLAVDA